MKLTLRMITSVASLMLACVAPAAAAPGDLDSSFGDGGRVTTSFGGGDDFASDVVVQPDGRIVVAGSTAVGGTQDFALARYLSDGSPDRSFSDDGRVTTEFPTGEGLERASGVALQPDGKIVASGGAGEFAVARYNVDGTLDTTFSGDGLQTVDVGTYESSASDVAVDALGRIILVGVGRNFDPVNFMDSAVARLAPDGSPDMTFGYNGVYTLDLSGEGLEHLGAVAPLPDGGFTVTGGSAYIGAPPPELVTRRFAQSGDEVEGFNRSREGRLVASGEAIDVQADGRTVIAGGARTRGVGVLRLLPDGSYDKSFSGDGEDSARIVAGAPGIESGRSVAVQTSRRIVVGAVAYAEDGGQLEGLAFGLLRFRPDGGLDTSFAGDGRQATRFGAGSSSLSAVALQGSRILAVGTAGLGSGDADFALAGYDGRVAEPSPLGRDGAPDSNIRRLRRPRQGRGGAAPRASEPAQAPALLMASHSALRVHPAGPVGECALFAPQAVHPCRRHRSLALGASSRPARRALRRLQPGDGRPGSARTALQPPATATAWPSPFGGRGLQLVDLQMRERLRDPALAVVVDRVAHALLERRLGLPAIVLAYA
jgi:uncharacterized delta-60 repeat protein